MSISPLNNRPSFSSPALSNTPAARPAGAPGVEGAGAPKAGNDLFQKRMSDSFEQDGAGLLKQMTQVLGDLAQVLGALGQQMGAQGGAPAGADAGAGGVNGIGGAGDVPDLGADAAGGSAEPKPSHPTYDSSAGPGFGPPSAGSNEPVDPAAPWLAKNNVGTPYNSNMQVVDPSQKDQFKFTNTFKNTTNEPQTLTLWNKTGEDGQPNSGQSFDKSTPKTFTLQPGESKTVAFDNNSSVAWAVSKDGSAKAGANNGQTWGEATFGNAATGWSGYDTSQISPAGHDGKMSITNDATGKSVTEADAWQTPSDNPAGHDVGVPAGPLHLSTSLG
jgi:hypothetical protein